MCSRNPNVREVSTNNNDNKHIKLDVSCSHRHSGSSPLVSSALSPQRKSQCWYFLHLIWNLSASPASCPQLHGLGNCGGHSSNQMDCWWFLLTEESSKCPSDHGGKWNKLKARWRCPHSLNSNFCHRHVVCLKSLYLKVYRVTWSFSCQESCRPHFCFFKAGQSPSSFEWWQSQNYDCLILPFTALVKKIKLKIMLRNRMHELLHGILKDRMPLPPSHSPNSMSHNTLICKGNNRVERKFCLSGNGRYIFKGSEKIMLVKVNNSNACRIFKPISYFLISENVSTKNVIWLKWSFIF